MIPGLMAPTLALIAVLLAGAVVLHLDRKQRQYDQQMSLVVTLSQQDVALADPRSIRREKIRLQRLRVLARNLFRYDPNCPDAYTVPVPLVVLIGPVLGVASGMFASTALAESTSIAIGCLVTIGSIRGLFGWQRDRYANKLRRQLPDALQFVVNAVRAGFPVTEALRGITRETPEPTRGQFNQVLNEIALGRSASDALLGLFQRTGVTEYAIFAVTLAVQTKSGGHLAETIQTLAETVRERITLAARAKALAGEGTVSATILSILPVVTGIALTVIRPDYLQPLFTDPRGRRLFFMGVASLLAGIWTMRRMIAGTVKE